MLRKLLLCAALTALLAGAYATNEDDYQDVLNFLSESGDKQSDNGELKGTPQPIPDCDDECAKKADPNNEDDEDATEDLQAPGDRGEVDADVMPMPDDEEYSADSVEDLDNGDFKFNKLYAQHAEELAKSSHLDKDESSTLLALAEKLKSGDVKYSEVSTIDKLLNTLEAKIVAAREGQLEDIQEIAEDLAEVRGEIKEQVKLIDEEKTKHHNAHYKYNRQLDLIFHIRKVMAQVAGKPCKMHGNKDCHSKAKWNHYNHCYAAAGSHFDHRSAAWTNMPGLECKLKTTGGRIRVTFDFSVYGNPHGGVRVNIDNGNVKGLQSHYGFDWVIPRNTNYWYKRSLVRVFDLPAGEHTFRGQFRSQANGYRTFIHGGSPSQQYSSAWMIIEEIPQSANFYYAHRQGAYNTNNGAWGTIQTISNVRTSGGCLKYQFDASIYGIHHGGMRLVVGSKVFGKQGTYGMDWMLAEGNNWWQKRNLVRFFCGLSAGTHTVHVQVRSQTNGRQLYIHGGSTAQMYSGSWYLLQEVHKGMGFNFVQCQQGLDQRQATWTNIPNCALDFSSSGKDTLFMVDFSVYGVHHGGIRIVNRQNNAVVVGHQSTYGMDWVIPHYNNIWQKRCMYRVLPKGKLASGSYSLGIQVRSQATNYRCYFHGGSTAHEYSGIWFAARELN